MSAYRPRGDELRRRVLLALLSGGLIWLAAMGLSCAGRIPPAPTPTPDYALLETEVLVKLQGTLTAKAPPPTHTSTPTDTPLPPTATPSPSPSATPSPSPTPEPKRPLLAYVHVMEDKSANILLYDLSLKESRPLTHFLEPQGINDLSWSRDGERLLFVSAHDYIHSRDNERNVFLVGRDGTGLRMVTGDYVDPGEAPGPYVILKGYVRGGEGPCLVCAQGAASPVTTDQEGAFELPGVPISATWARAICPQEDYALQGAVELSLQGDTPAPITITVEARGQGWIQASLSRDGSTLAGTMYRWSLDEEGKRRYQFEGVLYDLQGTFLGTLETISDTVLLGLDWSPVADRLVGALTGPKQTWLWLWDAAGKSLGPLVEIPNTEQEILSAANPAWSPDGKWVAFELRRWHWWEEDKHRTDLVLVPVTDTVGTKASSPPLRPVVEVDWGLEAGHPTWTADGAGLFYQLVKTGTSAIYLPPTGGDIWSVSVAPEATPIPWSEDGLSYLPALSPPASPLPKPDILR